MADTSVRSKTTRHISKLALLRVRVAMIVAAVVLFLASLTGIAIFNPQVGNEATAAAQPQQIIIVKPDGLDSLLLAPPPRLSAVRPLVRSRGS